MVTQEIPRDEWARFLDGFSRRHRGWLVSISVLTADGGARTEASELPLAGVAADPSHDDAVISISAGRGPDDHLTHSVISPTRVTLELTAEGADAGLRIESRSGAVTTLRFRSAVLPEMVDGVTPDW